MNLQTDFTTHKDDLLILDILNFAKRQGNVISSKQIEHEISKHYRQGTNQFDIIKGHCLMYLQFNGIRISHF